MSTPPTEQPADPLDPVEPVERQINEDAVPIQGTMMKSTDTTAMTAGYRNAGNRIEVILELHGRPHSPWKTADFVPDVAVGPVKLREVVGSLINSQVADVDALVRVTITKRADGMLEYATSGWHDLFGAWELYVNGQAAWLDGGSEVGALATRPGYLWEATGQTRPINEARVLPEPHK